METKTTSQRMGYPPIKYVHIIVTLFLMFGFGYLPPFATVTPMGMKVLGLFIGVVYAYSTLDIIWPSLLAIVAFGLSGFPGSMDQAASTMLGNSTVFQVITQNMTAGAIVIYGFGKWFARKTLSMKVFHGRPLLYTWCFLFVFMWANIVLNTIPVLLMLCAIWGDIGATCGYKHNNNFYYYGFGGIILTLMLGISMMPYRSWQLGLAKTWANVAGTPINLGFMFSCTAIIGIVVITAYVILGAKLLKVDFSHMKEFDVSKLGPESEHLRPRAKRIIIVYLITMLLSMFAGTFINTGLAKYLNGTLTSAGLYTLCTVLLMIIPSGEDDEPCIRFKDIKNSEAAINWSVILMVAVTIPLASALTNEATGISPWLTEVLTPIFAGHGPHFILVVSIITMIILTNIGSNIAMASALIPIIAPFALQSGANITVFGMAIIYSANMGLLLPGSSAPASILHARNEIPDMKKRTLVIGFGILLHVIMQIVVYSAALTITS